MSDNKRVSFEEQQAMGLTRGRQSNFVPAERMEILPPVRSVPQVVDPYAPSMPVVQQVAKFEANPITRAQAMTMKTHQITIALAILSAAAMVMLKNEFYFFWWLLLASIEWVATFVFLAVIDYRETPAAQNRTQMTAYIKMMDREQRNRLKAMYGRDYTE